MFGPPGAGKGTQAARVSELLGVKHIDTGSIIRDNIRNETDLGVEAKSYVDKGDLVSDDLIIRLIADRLRQDDVRDGWLLDGFPRSLEQARALSKMGPDGGEIVGRVVILEVPEDLLLQRLTSRRICGNCKAVYNVLTLKSKEEGVCDKCGGELIQRADDNEEAVRNRFRIYRESTAPIADYYSELGLIVRADGTGTVEEGTERIMTVLVTGPVRMVN